MAKKSGKEVISLESNVGPGHQYAGITYNHEVYLVIRDEICDIFRGKRELPSMAYRIDAFHQGTSNCLATKITDAKILEGLASEWIDNYQCNCQSKKPVIKARGNFLAPLNGKGSRIYKDRQ